MIKVFWERGDKMGDYVKMLTEPPHTFLSSKYQTGLEAHLMTAHQADQFVVSRIYVLAWSSIHDGLGF